MAQAFRFRLDTVLRLRRQARDAQQRAVAEAARAAAAIERHLDDINSHLRSTVLQSRRHRDTGAIDLSALRAAQLHHGWLYRQLVEGEAELARRRTLLQQERHKLGEAVKQVRVIENLRDRHWRRHQDRLRKQEQAAADEAAQQQYLRQHPPFEASDAA